MFVLDTWGIKQTLFMKNVNVFDTFLPITATSMLIDTAVKMKVKMYLNKWSHDKYHATFMAL